MSADFYRRAFLIKAEENLASATSELVNGRHDACANRAYYACFQAAIVALVGAGIRPSNPDGNWSHGFVQSQFAGRLVHRRKLYPTTLRDTLPRLEALREKADYEAILVSQAEAQRALERARAIVTVFRTEIG